MPLFLTPAQAETLSFIKRYVRENKYPPTVTEMQKSFKLRSLRSVMQRIEALERKGFIKRSRFQHRGIQVIERSDSLTGSRLVEVPVIASAGCDAMEVYAQDEFGEYILVDERLVGRNTNIAAVKAIGDSMQDSGIRHGDYVIVEVAADVENGDRVVAIIGNMAVIKQCKKVDDVVYLNPRNEAAGYSPIVVNAEDSKIFGKVLSVIPGSEWVDDIKVEYYPGYVPAL
jgi:repressor LexA